MRQGRILGVPDGDEDAVPKRLSDKLNCNTEIFADFTVLPLGPDRKGWMRDVKILGADHIVIRRNLGYWQFAISRMAPIKPQP